VASVVREAAFQRVTPGVAGTLRLSQQCVGRQLWNPVVSSRATNARFSRTSEQPFSIPLVVQVVRALSIEFCHGLDSMTQVPSAHDRVPAFARHGLHPVAFLTSERLRREVHRH